MKITEISIKRPISIMMFYLLTVIMGIVSYLQLSIDFLPDIGYPQLTVISTYPDASPEEVERLVTQVVEETVSTLKNVKSVDSESRENVSIVSIKYNWGTKMSYAALHLREKLDGIRYILPDEMERPNIARVDPSEDPVMHIAVSLKSNAGIVQLQRLSENLIKRRLQQLDGVASAEIIGDLDREVSITVDEDKLNIFGLNATTVGIIIRNSSFSAPGGSIKEGHYRFSISMKGEFEDLESIKAIPIINTGSGNAVLLGDIADVSFSYSDDFSITSFNSSRTLGLLIRKESGANTVQVCELVRETLKKISSEYEDIEFHIASDQSVFVEDSIKSVLEAIIIGAILAFIVLFFFLEDLSNPLQIAVVIPTSILITFIMMFFSKITLNIISLSGIALGVGMLVDNSIIVSESIHRYREKGLSWAKASFLGTKEVGLAITASTLTTLAVFIPILFVRGVASSLFRQQGLTVSFSLLSSLLVSVTLLPLLMSLRRNPREKTKKVRSKIVKILLIIAKIPIYPFIMIYFLLKLLYQYILKKMVAGFNQFFKAFTNKYENLLRTALNNSFIVLFIFMALLGGAFLLLIGLDFELFPDFEQSEFSIRIKLDSGISIEHTKEITERIETILKDDSRIESWFTSVGKSSEDKLTYYLDEAITKNIAEIKVKIHQDAVSSEVINDLEKITSKFPGEITYEKGSNILSQFLHIEASGLQVNIYGEDLEKQKYLAEEMKKLLIDVKGFHNFSTNYENEKPVFELRINRENAALYEIPVTQIANLVRSHITGTKVSDFSENNDKIDIVLKFADEKNLENLLKQYVHYGDKSVPLRLLVSVKKKTTLAEIHRADQNKKLQISFNYDTDLSEAIEKCNEFIDMMPESDNIRIAVEGVNKEISSSMNSLIYALIFAVMLVYMILASQFESFKLPFIIMFVVPMGLIGIALSLALTNTAISVMSSLGAIILTGIIVNDAILLVDYINQNRDSVKDVKELIVQAAKVRLRPILMTTFTTVFGLLPLALGVGSGAELQSAMAITVIGGITAATLLTLILTPVLYKIISRSKS